jgi:tetratricopeptide (TPR) repeat protein
MMLRRTVLVALAFTVAAAPARAAVESELIKQGVAAYEDLDYPKAIDLLQKALGETLTREEKAVTYKTLGFCHAALNQMKKAQTDFESLLRLQPRFELDRTVAPRVRAVFEQARAAVATNTTTEPVQERAIPTVEPQIDPAKPVDGRPLTVGASYAGGLAEHMGLFHRQRGQDVFSRVDGSADEHGRFSATVPGLSVHAPGVEFYLELYDESGVVVARAGKLGDPIGIDITRPHKPVYKRGWFWGVIGGVLVVGGAVAAAVLLTRPTVGPNTPASLTLQPF